MTDAVVGFLLVDKAPGRTSHDVVADVRRLVRTKVGHAGTLDPLATGLLVLGLGRATRLLRYVQGLHKEYFATARFGVATDTLDADGAVLDRTPLPVERAEVEEAAKRFVGTILQVPPMVSARKVGGVRLYELARRGEEVEREARPVEIVELEILSVAPSDYPEVRFRAVVGSGTYIRTLADDLARALGGHAHLTALRRTRIGPFAVEEARTVAELEALAADGRLAEVVSPPADALAFLPDVVVDEALAEAARHGAPIAAGALPSLPEAGSPVRVVDPAGELIGVFRSSDTGLRPEVVLA